MALSLTSSRLNLLVQITCLMHSLLFSFLLLLLLLFIIHLRLSLLLGRTLRWSH